MKKSQTKSILACAVLASVLTGGFFMFTSAEAAQVNALVGPKDLNDVVLGKDIIFGKQRGYVENQQLTIYDEKPTWQFIINNGNTYLLAKESWGKNRISDTNTYNGKFNPGATIQHYHYGEVLKHFDFYKDKFFTAEELAFLSKQTVIETWSQWQSEYSDNKEHGENKYESIFSVPSLESLNVLTAEQKKRENTYWLNNFEFRDEPHSFKHTVVENVKIWFDHGFIDTNGNYQVANGEEVKDFYPLLKIVGETVFAYYGDRSSVGQSFKKQTADSTQPLHLAFRNTQMEKDVQIEALEIASDKIKFTAEGLATGTGQGLAGILADNAGNYLSYARLADTSGNSRVENVTITDGSSKFIDNSKFAAGDYIVYLFNEKLNTDSFFDYVGNFSKLIQVGVNDSGTITKATLSGNWKIPNLTVSENTSFGYTMENYPGEDPFVTRYYAFTITNSLNWANVLNADGSITLCGNSFSVVNDTLTLTDSKINRNDMTYDGSEGKTATLHVNGDMHGLIVNGGTFTAEKDLKLSDYLKINNGATVEVKGKLNVALSGEITGTLQTGKDLDVAAFWHVYSGNKITAPNINIKHTLMLDQDAVIDGKCNVLEGGTLRVAGNCFVNGLNFAGGSVLQIDDGNKIRDKAAITYTTDIQAADKSKLIINNSKEGVEYKIVEKAQQPLRLMATMSNGVNPYVQNMEDFEKMIIPGYGMALDTDKTVFSKQKVSVYLKTDPNIRKYCDLSNVITGVNRSEENLLWLKELEYKLNNSSGADRELLNNYVNTFANLNSLANVQGGLRTMSSLVNDSIQENVGLRTEGQGKYDKQVWASFIHNKEKIEGRKTGHLQQNSTLQYNGVVVGADLWKGEHGFGGVALSYADGNFRDVQMITDVKNEVDYYGISVYNRRDVGKFNIIYDGGLTYAKNDISWRTVEGEYVLTKPKAMAYNAGFRVEEPIKLSKATELTPFAGLRYTFIKTKDYTDNYGDRFTADNQHLVNLPIGLTLKGTYETKEGWTLGGKLTGGYSWNLGNRTGTQSIGYAIFSDSMNFDVADRGEYFVKAGVTAEHKNLAFELGYRYSKGDTSRDNRWNVNVNWSF